VIDSLNNNIVLARSLLVRHPTAQYCGRHQENSSTLSDEAIIPFCPELREISEAHFDGVEDSPATLQVRST
jgi:hypothetical protein